MKTLIFFILLSTLIAHESAAQQFEVRKTTSNEPWYVSLCESSYTRYSGTAVYTYTVDSLISAEIEEGFASLCYLNDSLVSRVFIHYGRLYEVFSDNFLMIYNINPDTDFAGMYTDNSTAKARYVFPAIGNQKRIPEPSKEHEDETAGE